MPLVAICDDWGQSDQNLTKPLSRHHLFNMTCNSPMRSANYKGSTRLANIKTHRAHTSNNSAGEQCLELKKLQQRDSKH